MALTNIPKPYHYNVDSDGTRHLIEPGKDPIYQDPLHIHPKTFSPEENMNIIKSFGAHDHVFYIAHRVSSDLASLEDSKNYIKSEITHKIADAVMKRTTFTQILVPPDKGYDEVEVRARCVLMSVEELASLIRRLRRS